MYGSFLKGGAKMKFFFPKIAVLAALSIGTISYSSTYLSSTNINHNIERTNNSSAYKIYKQAMPSIFAVHNDAKSNVSSASGTAFAIEYNDKLVIVTNQHVVDYKAQKYFLSTKDGQKFKAKVIYSNKEDDIAFLELTSSANISPLELNISITESSIGDTVYTIGNPLDFLFSMSDGIISNIDKDVVFEDGDYDPLLIQTNINVNPGNSGGPLFNEKGEVIGIISSALEDSSGISFAIPSQVIQDNLKKIKIL